LTTTEFASSAVSGRVSLSGQVDHSGVLVQVEAGLDSILTPASGEYCLTGLYPGTYQITASKEGWLSATVEVNLDEGEYLTGVDLQLVPLLTAEFFSSPGLGIPDHDFGGITDVLEVPLTTKIAALEVFLDVTHPWIGNLIVDLVSPAGTTVRLHNRTGGATANLNGWFPDELTPQEDLSVWVGESAAGQWRLQVSDWASGAAGFLNAWGLRVTYPDLLSDVSADPMVPQGLALAKNYPNPFNPRTKIVFSIPKAMPVELAVFDLRGRRVATLLKGPLIRGWHEVLWQGTDDADRSVGSGVYFYRLQAEGSALTGQMLLLR
jgi:subtilisin-like proprotein convertase family protein